MLRLNPKIISFEIQNSFKNKNFKKINDLFRLSYDLKIFNEVKNEISQENNKDFIDIVDVVFKIPINYRNQILHLCKLYTSNFFQNKIISDIDNTLIEQEFIAPIPYSSLIRGGKNKTLIPGYWELVNYLSCGDRNPITLISARPKILERSSIRKLDQQNLPFTFSVSPGNVKTLVTLSFGFLIREIFGKHELANWSYIKLAEKKFENFLKIKQIYPYHRMIFLGDDTQGDVVFARMILEIDPYAFVFIRTVSPKPPFDSFDFLKNFQTRSVLHIDYYDAIKKYIHI